MGLFVAWSYISISPSLLKLYNFKVRMTLSFLCLYVLLCGVKMNMAKYPWDILLQNILISNPIMDFHLVCTLDVHKKKKQNKKVKKWCDWQKKNLSNYCTQSSTSPNLSDWWLHGFLNVFCVVDHSSVTSCTFPITLCPYKKYRGVMVCTSNDFLFPTSAPCQQHTDSWHHNSLCVCWKRLQRAREKLSPYFTL